MTGCSSASSPADSRAGAAADPAELALTTTSSAPSRAEWDDVGREWSRQRKDRSPFGQVSPRFRCIDKNADGSFTAHFGYKTSKDVTVRVGTFNRFVPAPADRGQPTVFKKSTNSDDLFTVKSKSKLLAWFLTDDVVVVSATSKVCAPPKTCPASCDDGNPCTADACSKSTNFQCTHVNVSNGAACGDGNVCNGSEVCQAPASGSASICTPGASLSCDDGSVCTTDRCDPTLGCQHGAAASGVICTPEAACTTSGTCDGAGTCRPGTGKNCDDGNPCTADSCDPAAGCKHQVTAGTSCSDGKACNGEETCSASGTCQAGAPLRCDDGNECTADSCNDVTGCVFDAPANQGRTCTAAGCGGSVCTSGVCAPTSGVVCNDNNPCTVDACVGNSCSNTLAAPGTLCSDGDFCNGLEACDATGRCSPGTPPCAGSSVCTTVSCDSAAGACVVTPKPDGTACEDNNVCTLTSACQGGACTKLTAKTCTSGWGPGDLSTCDPVKGCIEKPNCEPFLKGNLCQPLDPASPPGTCLYKATYCAPLDGCKVPECNPATGKCDVFTGPNYGLRNVQCDLVSIGCTTPPGGCGVYNCEQVMCSFRLPDVPNCQAHSQQLCDKVTTNACQTPNLGLPYPTVINEIGCAEDLGGCQYNVANCALSQPLGAPAPCQEYYEDPSTPGCCAFRPKVCRATDFGLPAGTTGYTFSCDATSGACVATPSP